MIERKKEELRQLREDIVDSWIAVGHSKAKPEVFQGKFKFPPRSALRADATKLINHCLFKDPVIL